MPIVFEEVSGEVMPDRERDDTRDEAVPAGPGTLDIEEQVRAVASRERRWSERLSDR